MKHRRVPGPNDPAPLVPPSHPALTRTARRIFTSELPDPVTGTPDYMISRMRALLALLNSPTPRLRDPRFPAGAYALAAPQCGWDWAVIVLADGDVWLDPTLTHVSSTLSEPTPEQCLSYPGRTFTTRSPASVSLTAYDEAHNLLEFDLGGLHARIALHELAHLQGLTLANPGNPRLWPPPLPSPSSPL